MAPELSLLAGPLPISALLHSEPLSFPCRVIPHPWRPILALHVVVGMSIVVIALLLYCPLALLPYCSVARLECVITFFVALLMRYSLVYLPSLCLISIILYLLFH
jgi:hypothetical protein